MATSRREFLGTAAAAAGAALVSSCSPGGSKGPPYQVTAQKDASNGGIAGTVVSPGTSGPLAISWRLAVNSGAPLGGIGTGFVEIHPDGCFYEWQIFNSGGWSGRRTTTPAPAAPPRGPQCLRFFLWTKTAGEATGRIRRLYLRSDDNSLYSMPNVQDIESIDYDAWFPMTGLRYNDPTIPVRLSAAIFSPFTPGDARTSATPGFHVAFTIENISAEPVEATIVAFFDDPILTGATDPKLRHTRATRDDTTSLFFQSEAQPADLAGAGDMCMSVTGGRHSCINGTYRQYTLPGLVAWRTDRVRSMELDVMQELLSTGRLANAEAERDVGKEFDLTDAQIDQLSANDLHRWVERLSTDALFRRVLSDAAAADPGSPASLDQSKMLLKEIARFADGQPAWGTGGLASSVSLAPGQSVDARFALSWFFPHHISRQGRDMGHMYANWFNDAAQVNQFLVDHYAEHRAATELFARTLADTSFGSAIAFAWSAQLSLAITCTWWTKDGAYAIWEGLGCCGLSTTDVDYQGSFPITALFPELKLGQMKRMIGHQNNLGQVPHNYMMDVNVVDNGWNRVDMNPQFVMMACRDYLWTGDRSYLEIMWPHIVKAMDFTASLDTNGDGLPDKDCGVQTYDQWRMRGAPSYIASLWIGGLRAAIRLAKDMNRAQDSQRWTALLEKASASFDKVLFNGDYYSLWVDGQARDEVCMSDQISGEWFSHLIGLDSTISQANVNKAVDNIWKYNFTPDFGLHNASAPRGGLALLAVTNLQAGGVWSGIEYAVASFLMDHGRYADGMRIVEAVHQRYLRAGQPWNHVECGSHYTRAMCSWTTLLAATGFKPDAPAQALTIAPAAPGDFHAPWATASGFGTITRRARELTIECASGSLAFKKLWVARNQASVSARLSDRALTCRVSQDGALTGIEFETPLEIRAAQACTVTNL